ncbi:MAG: hypothetical protein AAF589_04035 [Planctomycetota bacterium]
MSTEHDPPLRTVVPSQQSNDKSGSPTPIWRKVFVRLFLVTIAIVAIGAVVGVLAKAIHGRELQDDELGPFRWPIAVIYLASFFYMFGFLAFTVSRPLRYFTATIYCLIVSLFAAAAIGVLLHETP